MHAGILLVTLVIIAGCTGPPKADCDGEDCESSSPTNGGPTSEPTTPTTPPVDVELGFFAFENCTGIILGLEIPTDLAQEHVPNDFGPSSGVPFLASLGIDAYVCPRVVFANRTYENVATLWSYMNVVPENDSWATGGFSYYSYDVLVTNQTLADALVLAGTNAKVSTFERTTTPMAGGEHQEVLRFSSSTVTFEISYARDSEANDASTRFDRFFWFGSGPYNRVDVDHEDKLYKLSVVASGTLKIEGTSGFRDAAGSETVPFTAETVHSLQWVIDSKLREFKR